MNEKIMKALLEMDSYMPEGEILVFIYQHKKMLRFPMYLDKKDREQDLEVLDLSVRAIHCLRRAGYKTVGSLAVDIQEEPERSSKSQLLRMRNLGRKSAEEILLSLFCFQFRLLTEKEKTPYLKEFIRVNS